jgi:oxygen-independent coproporphyrinogen-3 oxidase
MTAPTSVPALADPQSPAASRQTPTYGVYIHVPFCIRKCSYCSFYSLPGHGKWFDQYVETVTTLIKQQASSAWLKGRQPESIFFGGGTPTVLLPEQLVGILHECRRSFGGTFTELEVSVEVNPATIDYKGLACLHRGGFNRISIGAQSLDDSELRRLGRVHTAADVYATVRQARKAGFANLSLDLMYGLPEQQPARWRQTLNQALELQPDHLSLYELTVEEKTPFAVLAGQGALDLPGEEDVLAMMDYSCRIVEQSGLKRYEISNYARSGYECFHNINYWQNGSYLGFGPGAVSCISGLRTTMPADVEQFCRRVKAGTSVVTHEEKLTSEERFRETVIMGLRMLRGVSLSELENRFAVNPVTYYGATLDRLMEQQMVEINDGCLRLTSQGLLLANMVMSELV